MQVIVLVGGLGTRLYPLTYTTPKVLLPIANKLFIEHLMEWFKYHEVSEVVFAVSHFASAVINYLDVSSSQFDFPVITQLETRPLGSGGALRNCKDLIKDDFILLNGDILTDLDLTKLMSFHKSSKALITATVSEVTETAHYGIVELDESNKVLSWQEKPTPEEAKSNWGNVGAWAMNPEILDYIPDNEFVSLEKDTFPVLFKTGVEFYGYKFFDYWKDIGTIGKYRQANEDVLRQTIKGKNLVGKEVSEGIWIDDFVDIGDDVVLSPPVAIGKNCRIGNGSVIIGPTIIGANSKIGSKSNIFSSIIWEGSQIGKNTLIEDSIVASSIIGRNCEIKSECVIAAQSTVSDGTELQSRTVVGPGSQL